MRIAALAVAAAASVLCAWAPSSPSAVVDAAFARMGPNTSAGWAFTKTTTDRSGVTVERFDGARWSLASVNGAAPSHKALQDWAKKPRTPDSGQNNRKLRQAIRDASLTLVSEDAQRATYGFQAQATDPKDKFTGHLSGQLVINKVSGAMESHRLFSAKAFSPMIGMNVERFSNEVRFAPVGGSGPVFFSRIITSVKGRLIGVKAVDESSTVVFSDYRRIAPR